jgi:alkylhydroperoxidase family enzyme
MTFTLVEPSTTTGTLKAEFEASEKAFGFIPNLHKALGVSEQALVAYKELHQLFLKTSFTNTEKTVIWQTINYYHQCHYCLPAHTAIAHMLKVDKDIIETVHNGLPLQDEKLRVLQETTYLLVEQRGHLTDEQEAAFKAQGYGDQQLIEIVLGIAQKVMSNYVNHIAQTPIDEAFSQYS